MPSSTISTMLLRLFLISLIFTFSDSSTGTNSMIVVWGKPSTMAGAVVNNTLDQNECVEACLRAQRCLLAHIMLNTTKCSLFMYNATSTVTKTSAANESVVAFKVTGSDVCPIGENAPTFDNQTANGYILIDDNPLYYSVKLWYNISFAKNVWSFSKKVVSSCQPKWMHWIKSDGNDICVLLWQVFKSNSAKVEYIGFNQTYSVGTCTSYKATLPGINTPNDDFAFNYLIESALDSFPTTNLYVRIDGKRTTACQANPTTPTCMSPAGFTFTDKGFKNFDNYNWVTNSSARAGSDDDCIVYVVNGTAPMKVDVRSCTVKNPIKAFGLLCIHEAYRQ